MNEIPVNATTGTTKSGHSEDKSLMARIILRLRSSIGLASDASLRESLEDVIEQHETAAGDITPEERSMLLNILDFGELRVDDVMVPRADIVAIEETSPLEHVISVFQEAGHSRLPVYHDTLDDPQGMVHIKDLFGWMAVAGSTRVKKNGKNGHGATSTDSPPSIDLSRIDLTQPLAEISLKRNILYVPPSMPVADLLVKMQASHIHMAIVVDEYGGTDGLVSIEDLVEEIVGEIEDEHDTQEGPLIHPNNDGTYTADARVPIEDLEKLLGVDFSDEHEEDIDTLGGLVFALAGRIPVRGELIAHKCGLEFEVLEVDPRRIGKVRISRTKKPDL
jgi:hemolysin (HlyC) family protein